MRNVALCGAAAVIAALALGGCGESEKSSRGLDYMPDMYESPAYRSQQPMQVVLKDGVAQPMPVISLATSAQGEVHHVPAMLTPPAGTVPRDFLPYPFAPTDFAAAHDLRNPYAPTPDVLRRGHLRRGEAVARFAQSALALLEQVRVLGDVDFVARLAVALAERIVLRLVGRARRDIGVT